MIWKIHVHFRVRNESICYIVFIDRTKPDNSVRINPANRHSETKYGFVILAGDMIFEYRGHRRKLPSSLTADAVDCGAQSRVVLGYSRSGREGSRPREPRSLFFSGDGTHRVSLWTVGEDGRFRRPADPPAGLADRLCAFWRRPRVASSYVEAAMARPRKL